MIYEVDDLVEYLDEVWQVRCRDEHPINGHTYSLWQWNKYQYKFYVHRVPARSLTKTDKPMVKPETFFL